jgi:oligopeptide transport system permease protein
MYFLKRILGLVPILFVISLMAFSLVKIAPGGPFDRERKLAPAIERNLRAKYHLDESFWQQYLRYISGVVRGDLGPSLQYRDHGVNDIIRQGLPVSLTLGALAFCFAMGLGIPLGVWSARHHGTWKDSVSNVIALLFVCVPAFVVGPLLVILFGVHWKVFPVALWESPWHAVLPTVTLGLYFSGKIARLTREGLLEVLPSPFIVAARAKGLSDHGILFRHALPIAILPVVSYSGPLLADLLTGSFVVENFFQIPGIGVFLVNSSNNRDYTMVVGLVLLYAVLLLALNLMVDWAYTRLDPRVRYE